MLFSIIAVLILLAINILFCIFDGFYKYAKKHVLVYSVSILLLVFYITSIPDGVTEFFSFETFNDIIKNVLSNYFIAFMVLVFWGVEKKIKNRAEDKAKLTEDYNGLAKRYKDEEMLKNPRNDSVCPVINLGDCNIVIFSKDNSEINDEAIIISDNPDYKYKVPGIIEKHYSEIMSVHDTSNVYNTQCIRATLLEVLNNQLIMRTERTSYFDSLVTNRASDYDIGGLPNFTVRMLFEPGSRINSLAASELSNHLGYNGFVESSDGKIVFVKRNSKVSIAKNTLGDSIGASLKTKYALEGRKFTFNGLRNAMINEIEDELCVEKEQIENIIIINAYRDLVECGKPQLLFYAKSNAKSADIEKRFKDYNTLKEHFKRAQEKIKKEKESTSLYNVIKTLKTLSKEMKRDGKKLVWVDTQAIIEKDIFDENLMKSGIIIEGKFYKMMPSALASIIMLKNYFERITENHGE